MDICHSNGGLNIFLKLFLFPHLDMGGQKSGVCCAWAVPVLSLLLCFVEPVSAQIKYTVPEEVKEGHVVGNIAKDLGLDVGTLDKRRFRIVSGSRDGLFGVNQNNGRLSVLKRVDREAVCDGDGVCSINLKVVVENPFEIHHVGVEIADVNDHSPVFPDKVQRVEIAENTLLGTGFQLKAARDPDSAANAVRFYKLSPTEYFELELRDSGEDSKIPILKLSRHLDRERQIRHFLTLTAVDGGTPPKTGSMNVTVTVLDNNDNRPVFSQDAYSVSIRENIPIGTAILRVNASDLDDGTNAQITYSFLNNLKPKVYDTFELNRDTGEIRIKGKVDFEDIEVYRADVTASDKGQPPTTTDCRVTIKIVDVNDNEPEIDVTSLSNLVPEDSRPGTVISLISVSDRDSGVHGKVLCSLSEDVPFELKPSFQDHMYSLVTKGLLDRETVSHYDIVITARDFGEPPLSSVKTLSVQVSDVNDNSPQFPRNPFEVYLSENNAPGVSIFSVSAADIDEGENAAVTYHIHRGEGVKPDVAAFLNINSENGNIYALRSFDSEAVKMFQFEVMALDSGKPPLSTNATVSVYIMDQNDNAPVILSPLSANGSVLRAEEIPRNANPGHLVDKVRAYDADLGYNGWLLFSLQDVSDHTLFGLDRYTGQIRTLRAFTETDEAQHKLIVLVKDNGNVSLSATATVIINVVEPKEAFSASDAKSAVNGDDENNGAFYLIVTLGSVSTLFLISVVVLIVMQCSKEADHSSKYLQDTNYDGTLCHSIQYRSGDKRYMLVGPRLSVSSAAVPSSNVNTLRTATSRKSATLEDCVYPGWILQHRASQAHSHTGMHADG
ncbi:protocadherin alpha-7-like isoform X1 [Denticeps clupeoides]|uniref:protocadherin alpha-7-like isoform X1 n=1 Tax=Denticeps clupeoides TaxID=299321 RepID=UPI0010A44064|nr:protocadherin alpha-7-like isoform X1 [Denticeps clupeoides]